MGNGIGRRVLACIGTLASGLLVSACVGIPACSGVGYIYQGPAVIEFDTALPAETTLAACFGEPCEPAPVARADGRTWRVPQTSPFLVGDVIPGEERSLRVVVTGGDGAVSDEMHEISVRGEKTGVFSECPGPFTFEPVRLENP